MKRKENDLPFPAPRRRTAIAMAAVVMCLALCLCGCRKADTDTPQTEAGQQTVIVTPQAEDELLPSPSQDEGAWLLDTPPSPTAVDATAAPEENAEEAEVVDPNASPSPSPTPKAHVHEYEKKVVKATCLDEGYTTNTCECGVTFRDSFTDPLGHDFVKEVHAASCTERGYTMYECSRCAGAYVEDYTDMLPHNYAGKVVAASCTEKGYEEYTCVICGDNYRTKEVKAFGHDYEITTVNATCTTNGKTVKTCATCGHTETENTEKAAHTWNDGEIIKNPGCETTGTVLYTCTVCGATNSSTLSATGHKMQTDVIKATCAHEGYTAHTCVYCGYFYEDNYTDMVDHRYSAYKVLSQPTCTSAGSTLMKCNVCQHETTVTTDATGHSYSVSTVVDPTETEGGYTVYTCSKCGDSYNADHTDPLLPAA